MIPSNGNGQLSVPPGFRFHPTDEELLYYYLKKKVSYEAIDLDVIREVDLNKLEPWDLKDRCRIGSGPQNEWYFFSHKDKKYPTGTRTNRATTAGFWKATGRDKAIYHGSSKLIGMRKTLVFYTGRAPHGQKTDWIMHEYRLNDDDSHLQQEYGWVVCRVFKKKNHGRGLQPEILQDDDYDHPSTNHTLSSHMMKPSTNSNIATTLFQSKQHGSFTSQPLMVSNNYFNDYTFDGTMHLPQLFNPDSIPVGGPTLFATMDNILRLTNASSTLSAQQFFGTTGGTERLANTASDLGFLDKLLANYQNLEQQQQHQGPQNNVVGANNSTEVGTMGSSTGATLQQHNKFPLFQYLGTESDMLKYAK